MKGDHQHSNEPLVDRRATIHSCDKHSYLPLHYLKGSQEENEHSANPTKNLICINRNYAFILSEEQITQNKVYGAKQGKKNKQIARRYRHGI